jgi:collagenase-like PrtC family protease
VDELGQVVTYAHSSGVRIYLTLNTLVKDSEIPAFFNVLSRVYLAGVDGVIIQHVSFLDIIKRNYPGLRVFISTQGAIGNVRSAQVVRSADRIILPREVPLDEIKRFTGAGIRTEVFVHGALCYSYSGLCLFSSFVGSRSGNRGSCAQLCRQRYNGEYPLSTRELCLARRIPELIDAGVEGFKIEGRMRSPLYVAVATRLYRKAIDSSLKGAFVLPSSEMEEMEVVFNREFTEGLVFGERNLTSPEKPMNRGAFLGEYRDGEILLRRAVGVGDGVGIWSHGEVSGHIIKELTAGGRGVRAAAAGETVSLGLNHGDGSKVYLTSSPHIRIAPDFQVNRPPVTTLKRDKVRAVLPLFKPCHGPHVRPQILVKASSRLEAIEASKAGADVVFMDIFSSEFPEAQEWREDSVLGASVPRVLNDAEIDAALGLLRSRGPAAVLAGNLGLLPACAGLNVPVFLDYSLNTFNDIDILFARKFNATPIMSPELSLAELSGLKDKDVAVFCHGDIVLVNTMIDPGTEELVDEHGSTFSVRREGGFWQILNSRPYGVFDAVNALKEHGFGRFYIDRAGRGAESVRLYRTLLGGGAVNRRARRGYTSGHLFKPVM